MTSLPAPNADQLAASEALLAIMHDHIDRKGGWISFADYMRMALYQPGLGYYAGGSRKFGAAGDFVTAPELSPLFGAALARPVAQVLRECGGDVMEVGAGSGRLAADLLAALARLDCLPDRYFILELSGELAERQRQTLAQAVPALLPRIHWLSALPEGFVGCVVGNEVLDAMPCNVVRRRGGVWLERGVAWVDGLVWQDRPLVDEALVAQVPTEGWLADYVTEVQPEACGFVASLAACVVRGALILPDYGFAAGEYYHPQRDHGTLMCHYRHHAHDDPFSHPGLTDITTHIDFSAIWRAADVAGWRLEGYASQAGFLIDAGIVEMLSEFDTRSPSYIQAVSAVQKLLAPHEMGELFKVIAFSKGMVLEGLLTGFRREDKSGSL
ncbi:MAG: SAM-dependent methyltransferase [Burkholderiales bacterium]|nr:SAM-dependent methyltransferase [Burkholderiales bacterium]